MSFTNNSVIQFIEIFGRQSSSITNQGGSIRRHKAAACTNSKFRWEGSLTKVIWPALECPCNAGCFLNVSTGMRISVQAFSKLSRAKFGCCLMSTLLTSRPSSYIPTGWLAWNTDTLEANCNCEAYCPRPDQHHATKANTITKKLFAWQSQSQPEAQPTKPNKQLQISDSCEKSSSCQTFLTWRPPAGSELVTFLIKLLKHGAPNPWN